MEQKWKRIAGYWRRHSDSDASRTLCVWARALDGNNNWKENLEKRKVKNETKI